MSNANVAYLILVGCAFGAFAVALSYGYLRCAFAERRQASAAPAPALSQAERPALRKAA